MSATNAALIIMDPNEAYRGMYYFVQMNAGWKIFYLPGFPAHDDFFSSKEEAKVWLDALLDQDNGKKSFS